MKPDIRHEATDVRVRPIAAFGIALTIFVVVAYVIVWWLFDLFAAREARVKPPLSPLAGSARQSRQSRVWKSCRARP